MIHEESTTDFELSESDPVVKQLAMQMAADFIGGALEWVYQGGRATESAIVQRSMALVFMTNPNLFGNQAQLAACLGVSRKVINTVVTSFRDEFGYQLPSMRKEKTRELLSKLKTNYHAQKP